MCLPTAFLLECKRYTTMMEDFEGESCGVVEKCIGVACSLDTYRDRYFKPILSGDLLS